MNGYSEKIKKLKKTIDEAYGIVIGAGAGLSTAAGYVYSGKRFDKYFFDFAEKYGFSDMYSGGFYPYQSPEEFWAFWSRYIYINRYMPIPNDTYEKLLELVKDRDYFVITTNGDHCFQRAGFDKNRLFYTQGDFGLFQCSVPCHHKTYDNEEIIKQMYEQQKDMRVPSALIPKCPVCGEPMTMNLRSDDKFVEDDGWRKAYQHYVEFIETHKTGRVIYLELGVGYNTPVIIKYPFWQYTNDNPDSTYVCINKGEADTAKEIAARSICIDDDIDKVINDLIYTRR